MISIEIGKIFCKLYNRENKTNFSAREIFRQVIAPILFDFNNKKLLINWTNSKFFINYIKDWTNEGFNKCLNDFCELVESEKGGLMDSLKVYGGCASPYDTQSKKYKYIPQTTSFCYEENQYFSTEERYYSWIGSAFLISCNGFYIAIEDETYVKKMYESIKAYHDVLINNADLKDKQLQTWNTLYFYATFNKHNVDTIVENYCDGNALKSTISFEHIVFTISKYLPEVKYINVESYGQMNVTCGAILINTDYTDKIADILEKIYKDIEGNDDFSKFSFSKSFGGKNLLLKAIESGCIYNGFFDPIKNINFDKISKSKLLIKYIETIMTEKDKELANNFVNAIKEEKKRGGKTTKNLKFEVSTMASKFIDGISEFVKNAGSSNSVFDEMVEYAAMKSNTSDFKLMTSYINYLLSK